MNFQMFKLDLGEAEEPEIKLPISIRWIMEKAREFQKNIYFCFINYVKAFDCVDHDKLENSQSQEYQTTLPASWEIYMQVRKQLTGHGTKDWF